MDLHGTIFFIIPSQDVHECALTRERATIRTQQMISEPVELRLEKHVRFANVAITAVAELYCHETSTQISEHFGGRKRTAIRTVVVFDINAKTENTRSSACRRRAHTSGRP